MTPRSDQQDGTRKRVEREEGRVFDESIDGG